MLLSRNTRMFISQAICGLGLDIECLAAALKVARGLGFSAVITSLEIVV